MGDHGSRRLALMRLIARTPARGWVDCSFRAPRDDLEEEPVRLLRPAVARPGSLLVFHCRTCTRRHEHVSSVGLCHPAQRRRGTCRALRTVTMVVEMPMLHDVARVLGASTSVHEAALAVAEAAVEALGASSAYVERRIGQTDTRVPGQPGDHAPDGPVEVLAAVGEGTPPVGLQVPFPGSLTPESVGSGEPVQVVVPDGIGLYMRSHLSPCAPEPGASCPALVVPIVTEGQVHGALVVVSQPGETTFTSADEARARALGDLAAAALRRVALVDALRESKARFREIAENIREFIWLSDAEFTRHYYVNPAYERIWGRSKESLYADPLSLLAGVHPDDRTRVKAALLGMPRGEYDIEFRVIRPDGQIRWVSSRGVPVRSESGEIHRIAGITEDITERKRAELEKRRLLERERAAREASEAARATAEERQRELERVTDSRARLIRGFTHDIKNPLGAADGFLALLEDGIYGELTEKQIDGVARARRSIRTALDLIEHLLELARAESGQLALERVPTDMRALVSEIGREFRPQAEAAGLSLSLDVPDQLPAIETDPARVRQVLANLLSNAVKYTPRGGYVTLRAGMGSRAMAVDDTPGAATRQEETPAQEEAPVAGEWVCVEVADNGRGIPPDRQAILFHEFTRFDLDAAQGAGIGLAISQRVAQALGGAITVESEVGVGSTFALWLPGRS